MPGKEGQAATFVMYCVRVHSLQIGCYENLLSEICYVLN